MDDPARSSLFWFTSVTVNGEIEQDDSHYTENGHSTYPGTMGDHGLWEMGGRREGRRERREGGRGYSSSIEGDLVMNSHAARDQSVASYLNCSINS